MVNLCKPFSPLGLPWPQSGCNQYSVFMTVHQIVWFLSRVVFPGTCSPPPPPHTQPLHTHTPLPLFQPSSPTSYTSTLSTLYSSHTHSSRTISPRTPQLLTLLHLPHLSLTHTHTYISTYTSQISVSHTHTYISTPITCTPLVHTLSIHPHTLHVQLLTRLLFTPTPLASLHCLVSQRGGLAIPGSTRQPDIGSWNTIAYCHTPAPCRPRGDLWPPAGVTCRGCQPHHSKVWWALLLYHPVSF